MTRLHALFGTPAILIAAGLAVSGCVAVGQEPDYYAHGPYGHYAPPRSYYRPAPAYSTFIFSYEDRDRRRGRPHRHRHHHHHRH